jgi:hypothetical protein
VVRHMMQYCTDQDSKDRNTDGENAHMSNFSSKMENKKAVTKGAGVLAAPVPRLATLPAVAVAVGEDRTGMLASALRTSLR